MVVAKGLSSVGFIKRAAKVVPGAQVFPFVLKWLHLGEYLSAFRADFMGKGSFPFRGVKLIVFKWLVVRAGFKDSYFKSGFAQSPGTGPTSGPGANDDGIVFL